MSTQRVTSHDHSIAGLQRAGIIASYGYQVARPLPMSGHTKMVRLKRYKGSRSEEHDREYRVDNVGEVGM